MFGQLDKNLDKKIFCSGDTNAFVETNKENKTFRLVNKTSEFFAVPDDFDNLTGISIKHDKKTNMVSIELTVDNPQQQSEQLTGLLAKLRQNHNNCFYSKHTEFFNRQFQVFVEELGHASLTKRSNDRSQHVDRSSGFVY